MTIANRILILFSILLTFSTTTYARPGQGEEMRSRHDRYDEFRPRPGRGGIRRVIMNATGIGGTTNGDRRAACGRAEDRALADLDSQCFSRSGEIFNERLSSCDCKKKRGSKDDYTCSVEASGICEISRSRHVRNYSAEGVGGTTSGDKDEACERAESRAYSDAERLCFRNFGEVDTYAFGSCKCEKKRGSKDDYTCKTVATVRCLL